MGPGTDSHFLAVGRWAGRYTGGLAVTIIYLKKETWVAWGNAFTGSGSPSSKRRLDPGVALKSPM